MVPAYRRDGGAFPSVLAIPAVPVVINLVHLPALPVAHAIQRFDARVTANGHARIDRLDVTNLGKHLELHVSVGQRASPEQR